MERLRMFSFFCIFLSCSLAIDAMHTRRDLRPLPSPFMRTSSSPHHRHPDHSTAQVTLEETFKALSTDPLPNQQQHYVDPDVCDCGKLSGCRCKDALWDLVLVRVDESEMEEGMMDQGYRQHI